LSAHFSSLFNQLFRTLSAKQIHLSIGIQKNVSHIFSLSLCCTKQKNTFNKKFAPLTAKAILSDYFLHFLLKKTIFVLNQQYVSQKYEKSK
jgi:hypothetical protein